MRNTYPNTADGDALQTTADAGSYMSKPMEIDFAIDVPNEASADACMAHLKRRGHNSEKDFDEDHGCWTVSCPIHMVPDYDEIVAFQAELDRELSPFGGRSDGWGTFGNQTRDTHREEGK